MVATETTGGTSLRSATVRRALGGIRGLCSALLESRILITTGLAGCADGVGG